MERAITSCKSGYSYLQRLKKYDTSLDKVIVGFLGFVALCEFYCCLSMSLFVTAALKPAVILRYDVLGIISHW